MYDSGMAYQSSFPMKSIMNFLLLSLKARVFYQVFLTVLILFWLFHASVWYLFTSKLLDVHHPRHVGDLARIGYQLESADYRITETTLPQRHIGGFDYDGKPVDIVTIGDSFSNGGGGGLNAYYQDFIASTCHCRVLNLQQLDDETSYIETIVSWINSGYIDKLQPKKIIVETTARLPLIRFAVEQNWELNVTQQHLEDRYKAADWGEGIVLPPTPPMINTANYTYLLHNLYYRFSPTAFNKSHVYRLPLKKAMFNVKAASTLLFYDQDVTSINLVTQARVSLMNDNFNHLARLLKSRGIELYVMIVVNKYDLYHPYLQQNLFPPDTLFPLLRPLPKEYKFVDTKAILSKLLQSGTKDVFFADDTHWSPIASEAVVDTMLSDTRP